MIEDMQFAGLLRDTQDAYVRVVRQLAANFRLSPDRLTERQLRDYLMHLREVRTVDKSTFCQVVRDEKHFRNLSGDRQMAAV